MGRLARTLTAALLVAAFAAPGGVAAGPCTSAHAAAGTRRAGLVVQLPKETKTFCIPFSAEEEAKGMSGADLLERSGLRVLFGGDRSAATVCRINDVGCVDTGKCFCDCPVASATDCRFWGYYTLDAKGAWVFSQLGLSARRVHDGDVDGWRYANHYTAGGGAPAAASLGKLCAAGAKAVAARLPEAKRSGGVAGVALAGFAAAAFVLGLLFIRRSRRARAEDVA
jgi:hypothetical protein